MLPHVGVSGLASTRELALRYPGCRNTENRITSPHSIFFGISQVRISGLASTRELALGYSGYAEIPKYRDLATCCHFWISHVGVSGLASTRELALRYPGCRNTEMSKSKRTILSRAGFEDLRHKILQQILG
jgi:hypothetical protein